MLARIAVGIVMFLCVVGLVSHLVPSAVGPEIAFADVRQQVEKARTVTFSITEYYDEGRRGETSRIKVLGIDLMRSESPNGYVHITDRKNCRRIWLDPSKKTALITQGLYLDEIPLYAIFRNRYSGVEDRAIERLPKREINGRMAVGFSLRGKNVWVDPHTRLPVRIEHFITDPQGRQVLDSVTNDIVFDAPLDESLFRLAPPPGYTVETRGLAQLPPLPADPNRAAPEVTPLVGIGPARFGMSKEEVIRALGGPDSTKQTTGLSSGPGAVLYYNSRGFELEVSHELGLAGFVGFTQSAKDVVVRDFRGKTTEDVGMGAGVKQIVKAYGRPDFREESYTDGPLTGSIAHLDLAYRKLRIQFLLEGDKLVRMEARAENPPHFGTTGHKD